MLQASVGGGSSLPTWATVVLALLGGGAVGGVVTALLQTRAAARQEWRVRLLAAAEDFSKSFWAVSHPLSAFFELNRRIQGGELVDGIELSPPEHATLIEAKKAIRDVTVELARVNLLFGGGATTREARDAHAELRAALGSLDPEPDYPMSDAKRSHEHLKKGEAALDRFADAARRDAVRAVPRPHTLPLLRRTAL